MIFKDKKNFLQTINKPRFTILAIDLGSTKCGLATWNSELSFALPLKSVELKNLFVEINTIKPDGIVVGISKPTEAKEQALDEMFKELKIPVIIQDESYSTLIANQMLRDVGLKRKTRNQVDDKLSAKLILDWFIAL